jgi:hypothetical protein
VFHFFLENLRKESWFLGSLLCNLFSNGLKCRAPSVEVCNFIVVVILDILGNLTFSRARPFYRGKSDLIDTIYILSVREQNV